MTFSVLFVCTGNICRSPMAEFLLRARIPAMSPIRVSSAGTRALVGHAVDAPSAVALRELGVDPSGHAARQLVPDLVRDADVVLTAETRHSAAIVRTSPLAFRTVFTMREFARLTVGLPPVTARDADGLRAWVSEVADRRGSVEAPEPGGDEIGDPFGAGLEQARQCAAVVSAVVDTIMQSLGMAGCGA
ncbi:MAG: low molecular weight phosphatase family protein [Jatrophihabitantaceae bacterium]